MTQEIKKTQSLAEKLAAIGKEIGAVDKSGKNTQQKYNYIEYGVVAGKIRELFDKYHIIIIPNVESIQQDEITSKYDSKGYHFILKMKFKIINGDNQEEVEEATWVGEGSDYGDKGINKAETSGTKYFLMRLFNVSEKGDDNDAETTEMKATSRSRFSSQEIGMAKLKLGKCNTMEELKEAYQSLGEIGKEQDVIKYTNQMKETIGNE